MLFVLKVRKNFLYTRPISVLIEFGIYGLYAVLLNLVYALCAYYVLSGIIYGGVEVLYYTHWDNLSVQLVFNRVSSANKLKLPKSSQNINRLQSCKHIMAQLVEY